jgi:hypothetical protein
LRVPVSRKSAKDNPRQVLGPFSLVLIEGENRDQGGSNGAGKSAIFEALTWELFGFVNRDLRGDDVIRLDLQKKPVKNTRVTREGESQKAGEQLIVAQSDQSCEAVANSAIEEQRRWSTTEAYRVDGSPSWKN